MAWELLRFGRATKVSTTRSVASRPHDSRRRLEAKKALKYPAVSFNGLQARAIGRGFGDCVRRVKLTVWACAILPEHAHLVIARHRYFVEQIANLLKGAATRSLVAEDLHPLADFPMRTGRMPKAWARGQWSVFLENERDVRRATGYVEENPLKEGKPRQRWSFVTPFEGLDAR